MVHIRGGRRGSGRELWEMAQAELPVAGEGRKRAMAWPRAPALAERYSQLLVFLIQDGSRLRVWGGGHCLGFI